MALHEYDVVINGMTTTLQLSDEDAARMGISRSPEPVAKKAPALANKSRRRTPNKAGQ